MAIQYSIEDLLLLRSSPLCVKPTNLPPREDYMGNQQPQDTTRTQNKTTTDRLKTGDGPLLDQTNRRSGVERNVPRNGGGSETIVLGPPRTSFASATLRNKPGENDRADKAFRDPDSRDRIFRTKTGEGDSNDRFRDGRSNNLRRRGDGGDQDTEGWSTVKPRKSFGQEGAERFNGRMGGGDRYRDDRGPRERDDRESTRDRPRRIFDNDADEGDATRRNGLTRGKSEPWFKESTSNKNNNDGAADRPSQRERIDRQKSWRERDNDERSGNTRNDRNDRNDRGNDRHDRRWDRDQRNERDPEWLDEPLEEKGQAHTEDDFKKFMASMKASNKDAPKVDERKTSAPEPPPPASFFSSDDVTVKSAPAVEHGPDKFFAAFAASASSGLDATSPAVETKTEAASSKMGKSSRFTSFFSAQGGPARGTTEPPTPAAAAAPAAGPPPPNGVHAFFQQSANPDKEKETEAFNVLLQKLKVQSQTMHSSPTPQTASPYAEPSPMQTMSHKSSVISPEPLLHHQYGLSREEPRQRSVPPTLQEIHAPRPMQPPSQPPSAHPEQMLQDLLGQRHNAPSQGSGRMEQPHSASISQTDFLMQLMQSGRAAPEPPRIEQVLMGPPQPRKHSVLSQLQEQSDYGRERIIPPQPRQQMRTQGPPSYLHEEQFRHSEGENRPLQPTQILQRPPPGLDHGNHGMQQQWMQGGVQMPPTQRPMIPPPGLMSNHPARNVPVPGMYQPNFPPGVFPIENMAGPPRNMQPPPGFYGGPPPGAQFVQPPGMGGFQGGPDAMSFVAPFDGRGMPPPGAGGHFRR